MFRVPQCFDDDSGILVCAWTEQALIDDFDVLHRWQFFFKHGTVGFDRVPEVYNRLIQS